MMIVLLPHQQRHNRPCATRASVTLTAKRLRLSQCMTVVSLRNKPEDKAKIKTKGDQYALGPVTDAGLSQESRSKSVTLCDGSVRLFIVSVPGLGYS